MLARTRTHARTPPGAPAGGRGLNGRACESVAYVMISSLGSGRSVLCCLPFAAMSSSIVFLQTAFAKQRFGYTGFWLAFVGDARSAHLLVDARVARSSRDIVIGDCVMPLVMPRRSRHSGRRIYIIYHGSSRLGARSAELEDEGRRGSWGFYILKMEHTAPWERIVGKTRGSQAGNETLLGGCAHLVVVALACPPARAFGTGRVRRRRKQMVSPIAGWAW